MSLSNIIGLKRANVEEIQCRHCKNATKGEICKRNCKAYEKKPEDVYYENASCPKFEKGEDLLKYEIDI